MFISDVKDKVEAVAVVERLRGAWLSALAAEGLDGNGAAFDVRGAAKTGIVGA